MEVNITKGKIQYFKKKLGGRIIYSTHNRALTPEYDYIIYTVCNHYRAKRKTMWDCAIEAHKEHRRLKIQGSKRSSNEVCSFINMTSEQNGLMHDHQQNIFYHFQNSHLQLTHQRQYDKKQK